MLIETAIGDAYGQGFEYIDPDIVRNENDLTHYRKHPKWAVGPGQYTDDTQMSLGTAEAILKIRNGVPATRELFALHFVNAFKRDQREAYAESFYKFLLTVEDEHDFIKRILPDSDRSGGAMRAGPIGVMPNINQVKSLSALQASLTHDTQDGRDAAIAAALMTHYFLYGKGPKRDLGAFLQEHVPTKTCDWNSPRLGRVGQKGWQSVCAAVTAITATHSLADCLRTVVGFTGDVDTAGAIAMSAASCSDEMHRNLPKFLFDRLENGKFGREYLIQLDQMLLAGIKDSCSDPVA
jgi:ADP-ribosylglycohydrolase